MKARCCCVRLECQENPCCETEQSSYEYCSGKEQCKSYICVMEPDCCPPKVSECPPRVSDCPPKVSVCCPPKVSVCCPPKVSERCPPRVPECEDPCEGVRNQSHFQSECVEKEKPKKSFWQQLFCTDKKCCSSLKKKCKCIKKNACKCKSDCRKEKCQEVPSTNKCCPCECNSKANNCAQKPCMPTRKSICGCHFYINVENRPIHNKCVCKKTKPITEERGSCLENGTSETYGYNVYEEPVRDNESVAVQKSMLRSRKSEPGPPRTRSQSKNLKQSVISRKSKLSECCLKEKEPETEDKNVRIGVTVTKKETKYYKPNVQLCENKTDENCCDVSNTSSEVSNENVNNITVEIDNSKVTVTKNDKCENTDETKCPKSEICKSKDRRNTVEDHHDVPRESRADQTHRPTRCTSRKSRVSGHNMLDLDKRVSEILRKLDCIEQKITTLEKKNEENKAIRIDFDGQKSTVSLHMKDKQCEKKSICKERRDKSNSAKCRNKTFIEIKRSKSSSCVTGPTKPRKNIRYSCSRSLERSCDTESSCQKIIISLPSRSRHCDVKEGNGKVNCTPNDNRADLSWCDISKDLRSSKCIPNICYCIECCQKRSRCI